MKYLSILILMLIIAFADPAISQSYSIDAGHSSVTSSVQRFGAVDVVGRFKEVSGQVVYNAEDISTTSADIVIKVDSYDANNIGGEEAVKSEAFLNAAAYPDIKFVSKRVYQEDGKNWIVGDLNIHGSSNEVSFPFEVIGPVMDPPSRKQSIAIVASLTINRQDYGVSFDRKFPNGTEVVSNMVKIDLNVLAIADE